MSEEKNEKRLTLPEQVANELEKQILSATPRPAYQPMGPRLLIEEDEPETKTSGGILLPQNVKRKVTARSGLVIRVGQGYLMTDGRRLPLEVKQGDRVWFASYAGQQIVTNGRCVIVHDQDILAVEA